MQWLDESTELPPTSESMRRGPPRLPGLPDIPPMPVTSSEVPAPTNKTIEVEPQWLELVEERRAKNAQNAKSAQSAQSAQAPIPKPAPIPSTGSGTKEEPAPGAQRARPRIRPIIPREEE